MVQVLAPAKLNLGLRLLARRPDGYHELETLFLPISLYDRLEVTRAERGGARVHSGGARLPDDASNLAARGALAACEALGFPTDLTLRLEKRIPIAAGLGGGSSDAAAALLAVEVLAGRRIPEAERQALARAIGADVPFFLDPRPAEGRGVGDLLEPLEGLPQLWWVVIAMPFQVSTAEAYSRARARLTLPREASSIAALLGPSGLLSSPPNDLEAVADEWRDEIMSARRALERVGAQGTGMSGSGPSVYGGFGPGSAGREAAEEAARSVELLEGARAVAVFSPSSDRVGFDWGVAKW